MANKYTRKGKEAKPQEDEFVTFWERAWEQIKPQLRSIAIGVGALVAVVAIGSTIMWFRSNTQEDATEMFSRAVRIHDAELLPADKDAKDAKDAKDQAPQATKDKKSDDDVPRFKTAAERDKATLAELDKLEQSHGSSSVAKQAKAFRAGVLFELGQFDDAKKAADDFANAAGRDNPLAVIAREQAGIALESEGKLDEAMKVYKELETADKSGDFFRDRAVYDEARVLAKKGDTAGAKDLYKKLVDKSPTGILHDEAQNRLAQLGG